ncbi:MAG: ADP-ribosylglycohydrolase family protein [Pleurocapsa minor GSE-CHR-MK-17-07R]|jgi:ADP-ribosylglycohydrolase|nr:ADP-ribosylglycohydrolase family protein [Pleurocapsa minor GSE-CHR-MK 17-07R]
MTIFPADYLERTYAGVLGKMIGVYLGRPFENWPHERILAELGEIQYYVHEKRGMPLIVTDDDLSGTFTFVRALADYGFDPAITPAQIGQTWLNYIIENKTILWWGGMGNSTEHTVYLRLKQGVSAPHSGSIALNGRTVAEQIGAQIFIDGWAMVVPGDPERAADLARRAASVSHDGEAVYGAQVLAAMESLAYSEARVDTLLDTALALIPADSVIRRMVGDVRDWHAAHADWREARAKVAAHYGYDKWRGNCHIVPNHALIVLGLLYGADDFQRAMMIVNTSGNDTDCNAGNLGCLLGIRGGLAALESGPDWRGPVADRLYLPTADGGRAITDAVTETLHLVNTARRLAGEPALRPKGGSRFHFELPGSVQGFMVEQPIAGGASATLDNVPGHSATGSRSLAIRCHALTPHTAVRISTPTFIPPEAIHIHWYQLHASPTLYPGQTVTLGISADDACSAPVSARLFVQVYRADESLERVYGPSHLLAAGESTSLAWTVPDMGGAPIAAIGLELGTPATRADGTLYLDYLTWGGVPNTVFRRPDGGGAIWGRAWVNGMDHLDHWFPESFRACQNAGTGLAMIGGREWDDYQVSTEITAYIGAEAGIAARVQGMRRYYALLLCDDQHIRLVKALDGRTILAEAPFAWEYERTVNLRLHVQGNHLRAWADDVPLFDLHDTNRPLTDGGIALVCTRGSLGADAVTITPASD